jgi:fibronectin type III domain protein
VTRRVGSPGALFGVLAASLLLVLGGLAPNVAAVGPDRSDVVLELDFSASILRDSANRNRFAAALEAIAARVDETAADLVVGDTTVSLIQFASRAADYPGCTDITLLNSPQNVTRFSGCLRSLAQAYRRGPSAPLTKKIGVDTNYVAAMQAAAKHLPADATRPALILFTDGKHEVKGVPASRVIPVRDQLFGNRTPFALLPVGMGLDPKERGALTAGLERLKIVKDMPACVSGSTFEWPTVSFNSAAAAGNAVAVALQDATCTFTVAPTPTPPTPPPAPTAAPAQAIQATPGDGKIDLTWSPPVEAGAPVTDYQVRCRPVDGDPVESTEGVSIQPHTTVEGLANGTSYTCEVATVSAGGLGAWVAASSAVVPIGRPPAPLQPIVSAENGAVLIQLRDANTAGVDRFQYECSSDNGATWPAKIDTKSSEVSAEIGGLENGVEYRCRAYAANSVGISDASPVSDAARPCSGLTQCNPLVLPIFGGLGGVLLLAILAAVFFLLRGRPKGYVVAVVDVIHTANIGHGTSLGIGFTRAPDKRVTGIVADTGRHADIRIRQLKGSRFEVRDRTGKHVVNDGDSVIVADAIGVKHSLVLHGFATNAASQVATRR